MPDCLAKFDDLLEVRPPLSQEQLSLIPAKRGVVALLAEDGKPIVLLTAGDIRARVRSRLNEADPDLPRRSADLRRLTRAVQWALASSHFETDLRFFFLAQSMWPDRYASMLAWKPAWFVHVDPGDDYPHFSATRKVWGSPGRYTGPFSAERAAQHFIEVIQDGFDLCRDYRCLRRSPNAERCTYGQMGRCVSPCDGTMPMSDYRRLMTRAADFAEGARQDFRREMKDRMKVAADALNYESAAAIKARLERLGELDGGEFQHVRPAEQFQFILVQRGRKRTCAEVFLVDRGRIFRLPPIEYPPPEQQLQVALAEMQRLTSEPAHCDNPQRQLIGLVSHYLFSGEQRRGLIVRWKAALTAAELAGCIEEARETLALRQPPKRPNPRAGKTGP